MDGKCLRFGFLANHYLLTVKLDTESLLPYLVSEALVSTEDSDLIRHEITSSLKTDKLLTTLHRAGTTNPNVYVKFYDILSDRDITSGQNLDSLVERIKLDSQSEEVQRRFGYVGGVLEERHNAALRINEDRVTRSLDVRSVLPQLVSYGVVSVEESLEIRSKPTLTEQAKHLLEVIMERGSSSFSTFVKVLSEFDINKHLADVLGSLVDTSQKDDKYVEEVLKQGHVPPQQNVYVERKKMIQKIRNELYKLKSKDGWVLVHGMAGFGKTVLAAEAVRDARILRDVFPGGVNWLTVGQMVDSNGDLDTAKLLNKLQTLILRLDKDKTYRPPNVEAATDYLQEVILDQHPNSLLILDDVWSPDVAESFAVRCRTMVTSRNAGVANGVMTPNLYPVSVSDGFTEEEGRGLLAQWLKTTPDELPVHADTILDYCRGSPMAISLIGANLRKSSNEAKWKAIAEKLKTKHYHLHAGHAAIRNWTYQHPTLNASIELSVESLPDHLREYFNTFVIFEYDVLIPIEAIATIWGTDVWETEEFMTELVDYSLAQKANPGAQNPSSLIYLVHDIVLDYLKDTVSSNDKMKFHQKVVSQYSKKCGGAFPTLQSDGYVYQKLMEHMAASGDYELIGDLLTNLQWLISSVRYGDANTLLAYYRKYKSKVPEQFATAVQQFELFLSGNMFNLDGQPKSEDILQVTLMQPDTSEVYLQANAITRKEGRKSWFKWINKESDPEKYALKLKMHNEGVRRCRYSQDGTKVLSCAASETKLWDSSTGMILAEYKGHTDRVTCCALSKSGRHVASSSEDSTVKVWDTRTKRLICNFEGHQYGVQCCDFSPDETMILSGDIDSCIMLWETKTGRVIRSWTCGILSPAITPVATPTTRVDTPPDFLAKAPSRGVSSDSQSACEGVLSCAFSPVDKIFVTTSQNGVVRVWDYDCTMVNYLHEHIGQVRCSVFNKTGEKLATASLDGTARVWDVKVGECDLVLTHGEEDAAVLSCDFSPDSKLILTGDNQCTVKMWSLPQGILLQDLPLHWDFVNCVLYSPVTNHILSAGDNGIIKILWDEGTEEETKHLMSNIQYHRRFTAHFTKQESGYDPLIVCYYPKEKNLQVVKGPKADVVVDKLPVRVRAVPRCWVISNRGDKVVVGFENGLIQLFQLHEDSSSKKWSVTELWSRHHSTATASNHLSPHSSKMKKEHDTQDSVLKCFFSPDDTKIVSCSSSQHKMWKINGSEIAVVTALGTGVRPCMFFKDNIHIVSSQIGHVLLWDSNTGVPKRRYEGITDAEGVDSILCVNLSEDNKRVIASATSGLVMVWNVDTAQVLLKSEVMPMNDCARSCALSPDGLLAVAGFDDGSMKVWNVGRRSREIANRPTGSDYWVIDVAFSPDGKTIVTLCDSIQLWKPDGTHLKRVMLKGTFGKYVRFSPDFSTFVTIDNAGLLYILTTLDIDS